MPVVVLRKSLLLRLLARNPVVVQNHTPKLLTLGRRILRVPNLMHRTVGVLGAAQEDRP